MNKEEAVKKDKIPKEEGGGVWFVFEKEELEEILTDHLIAEGEEIPKEEVDVEYCSDVCGGILDGQVAPGGGALIVTGKRSKSRDDDDDVPF
jgi:hypothetical protein